MRELSFVEFTNSKTHFPQSVTSRQWILLVWWFPWWGEGRKCVDGRWSNKEIFTQSIGRDQFSKVGCPIEMKGKQFMDARQALRHWRWSGVFVYLCGGRKVEKRDVWEEGIWRQFWRRVRRNMSAHFAMCVTYLRPAGRYKFVLMARTSEDERLTFAMLNDMCIYWFPAPTLESARTRTPQRARQTCQKTSRFVQPTLIALLATLFRWSFSSSRRTPAECRLEQMLAPTNTCLQLCR